MSLNGNPEFSVVIPCLNEGQTLGTCIKKAMNAFAKIGVCGEVVIADNGSTDNSRKIALQLNARVVEVTEKGYGNALMGGIKAAHGKYIIMGDADGSYDFSHLQPFVDSIKQGYDLVMGNRFAGGISPGAMPKLHKYIGNPALSFIGRLFFKSPCGDFHCGMRAFTRDAFDSMQLKMTGMEFASEMVIKATLAGLSITEVPITLSPDGRGRPPHLNTWQDGWRHLRLMLLFSPKWLFYYPGLFLMFIGFIASVFLVLGPVFLLGVNFDIQTLLFAIAALILGYQSVLTAVFKFHFSSNEGNVMTHDKFLYRLSMLIDKLEYGLVISVLLFLAGFLMAVYLFFSWGVRADFSDHVPAATFRVAIPSVGFMIMGGQTFVASFFLSALDIRKKKD